MSTSVGPMPSDCGDIVSSKPLPYAAPLTVDEQWRIQNERKSQWEQDQERRKSRRARLEEQLQVAEEKALAASAQLPIAKARKQELLSPKVRNSEEWLMQPGKYAQQLKFADRHISDCETALAEPERIRKRIERLDAELEGDELALITAWNVSGDASRKLLLRMIGLSYVDTDTVSGIVNTSRPLPTTKG